MPGCPQGLPGKGLALAQAMRVHFSFRHPLHLMDTGGNCFPPCKLCGVQSRDAGTARHEATSSCCERADHRNRHAVASRCSAAAGHSFTAYGKPLVRADTFKYLGRILVYDDGDLPAARRQLKQARQVWGRLRNIITKENIPPRVAGMFYQAAVAAVLLYGRKSWMLPATQLARLEGFHVECARRLTGMKPRKRGDK